MKRVNVLLVLGYLCLTNFCFSQAVLVAHYPLDGNANEVTGGNSGVLIGTLPTLNSCSVPTSAISFNGNTDYIEAAYWSALNTQTALSLCAWVKFDAWYTGLCQSNHIVSKGRDQEKGGWRLLVTDNSDCNTITTNTEVASFGFIKDTSNNSVDIISNQNLALNQWYFLVGTYDLSTGLVKIYINGNLDNAMGGVFSAIPSNTQNLTIGGLIAQNGIDLHYPLNGDIDDVRIYNGALTAQEILDLYNQHCWPTMIEKDIQSGIKLFPNPVAKTLEIEWNTIQPEKIEIMDFTGKSILQKDMETGNENTNIDVSNLAKGIYLVKVFAKEKEYLEKFVKE